MDLEIILSEESQTKTNIIWYHLYVESNKKWYKWTYLQNRNWFTDLEIKLMVTKGEMEEDDQLGDRDSHIHTTIYKTDNQQGPNE